MEHVTGESAVKQVIACDLRTLWKKGLGMFTDIAEKINDCYQRNDVLTDSAHASEWLHAHHSKS